MNYAISLLEKEKEQLILRQKNGDETCSEQLHSIVRALKWLKLLHQNDLDEFKKYEMIELPLIEGGGGFSCYRIMIDNESNNKIDWDEYEVDGENIVLSGMDYIIQRR